MNPLGSRYSSARSRSGTFLLTLGLWLILLARSSVGNAQTFSVLQPANACSGPGPKHELAFSWDSLDPIQGVELHYYWNGGFKYHNNQRTERFFVANQYVGGVDFRFANRDMAANDTLTFQQGTSLPPMQVGSINSNQYWAIVPSGSLAIPISMTFLTNASVGRTGFIIDRVRYCREAPAQTYTTIQTKKRIQGLLLGTNDTVFMRLPGTAAGTQLNLVAWPGTIAPANFDLYARCGSPPTPTLWTAKSAHTSDANEEFLTISNAQCGSGANLYVAVNSTSGFGSFNLLVSPMEVSANLSIKVAVEGPTQPDYNAVIVTLSKTAKYLYAASDGQVIIGRFDVMKAPPDSISDFDTCRTACQAKFGAPCGLCFLQEVFGGTADNVGSPVAIVGRNSAVELGMWNYYQGVTHELAHPFLPYMYDEYGATNNAEGFRVLECGHSVMGTSDRQQNFCAPVNHELDKQVGTNEPQSDVWSESSVLHSPPGIGTPDWYNFQDHNWVGGTIIVSAP